MYWVKDTAYKWETGFALEKTSQTLLLLLADPTFLTDVNRDTVLDQSEFSDKMTTLV